MIIPIIAAKIIAVEMDVATTRSVVKMTVAMTTITWKMIMTIIHQVGLVRDHIAHAETGA